MISQIGFELSIREPIAVSLLCDLLLLLSLDALFGTGKFLPTAFSVTAFSVVGFVVAAAFLFRVGPSPKSLLIARASVTGAVAEAGAIDEAESTGAPCGAVIRSDAEG